MAYDATQIPINAFNVTPSDTVKVGAFGFICPAGGNVAVMPSYQEGRPTPTPVNFIGLVAGHDPIMMSISRFMATGTTGINIVAFGPV